MRRESSRSGEGDVILLRLLRVKSVTRSATHNTRITHKKVKENGDSDRSEYE